MPPANPQGKDTEERYRLADGTWTPERTALHDKIVSYAFAGKTPVDKPVAYMMGGGPAAGKSVALDRGGIDVPDNAVHIDPDAIKTQLPEYQQMVGTGDKGAAAFSHEESSYLAKRIQKEASASGYNTVLDGTGNGSTDNLAKKVDVMRARGQRVVAHYVTVDTEVAVARAMARAEKTGRFVAPSVVRETHAGVSRILPEAVGRGLFDEMTLWDTNEGGLVKVAEAKGSELTVHNREWWDRFLAKAG